MDHPALAQIFTPTSAPTPESLGEKPVGAKRKRPRRRRRKPKAEGGDAGSTAE
jgi:hypothetical protein